MCIRDSVIREEILSEVRQLNQQGLRVLGVAYKSGLREGHAYTVDDEGRSEERRVGKECRL